MAKPFNTNHVLLFSDTSRTSLGLMKQLIALKFFLIRLTVCAGLVSTSDLFKDTDYSRLKFSGWKSPRTGDGALGLGGVVAKKLGWGLFPSSAGHSLGQVLRAPDAQSFGNFRKGVECTTQAVGGGWE